MNPYLRQGLLSAFMGALISPALAALTPPMGEVASPAKPAVVATVDGEAINLVQVVMNIWQQNQRPPRQLETTKAQSREQLIDLQLQSRQALAMGLDRQPGVVALLEVSRLEILARAYAEQQRQLAPAPTPEAIDRYYDEHPELFSQRQIYQIKEVLVTTTSQTEAQFQQQVASAETLEAVLSALQKEGATFTVNSVTQPAENLPLNLLPSLAQAKVGKPYPNKRPNGYGVLTIEAVKSAPVNREAARSVITLFLSNQGHMTRQADDVKALRSKARIERMEVPGMAP